MFFSCQRFKHEHFDCYKVNHDKHPPDLNSFVTRLAASSAYKYFHTSTDSTYNLVSTTSAHVLSQFLDCLMIIQSPSPSRHNSATHQQQHRFFGFHCLCDGRNGCRRRVSILHTNQQFLAQVSWQSEGRRSQCGGGARPPAPEPHGHPAGADVHDDAQQPSAPRTACHCGGCCHRRRRCSCLLLGNPVLIFRQPVGAAVSRGKPRVRGSESWCLSSSAHP